MKYKTLESMRQTRLMLTEVIIPIGTALVTIECTHPELKYKLKNGVKNTKNKIVNKLKKKGPREI